MKSRQEKIEQANRLACNYLALYNEAVENSKPKIASKHWHKAQYWLDRLNKLEGLADDGS